MEIVLVGKEAEIEELERAQKDAVNQLKQEILEIEQSHASQLDLLKRDHGAEVERLEARNAR